MAKKELAAAATPEEAPEQTMPIGPSIDMIFANLAKNPAAPTRMQYDQWLTDYDKKVYISVFSPREVYFFRPMRYMEHKEMSALAKQSADPEMFFNEMLIERCVIWPKIPATAAGAELAGTIQTLATQIQRASNFMSEAEAYSIVLEPEED